MDKRYILGLLVLLVFVFIQGCKNPIKEAKAERIREKTRQMRDMHNQQMNDNEALTETRLMAKQLLIVTGTFGSAILIIATVSGWTWYIFGKIKMSIIKDSIIEIADPQGRRFPVIIADNSIINLSTGERFKIGTTSSPQPLLVESTTKVQIATQSQLVKHDDMGWTANLLPGDINSH